MKLIFLALCLSSVAIMAHGQSASSILKMASYANRLQKVPGMNRVMNSMMGRVVTKGGGMMATVLTSEKSTGLLSRTVGRVGAFIGRVMIRVLSIVNNIITWFAKKGVNILGFVAELPLTLFNAMRMNAELLISTMDKYNIGIPGAIRNLEYIFFGIRPIPNLPMLASPMGTESMNLSPMGMGMSTQPMMMGPN